MKRWIISFVLVLVLSAITTVATANRADAHNSNPYAAWACGATRPSSNYTLVHSHPVTLTSEYLVASCIAVNANTQTVCTWAALLLANGSTFGPQGSYHCAPIG